MDFKDQLAARRSALGISVAVAAARAGVEGPNYRAWEAGRRTPPEERQAVILAALEVTEDRAEFQRGALWALSAMHETLGRLYREMAQPAPNGVVLTAEEHRQVDQVLVQTKPIVPAFPNTPETRARREAARRSGEAAVAVEPSRRRKKA